MPSERYRETYKEIEEAIALYYSVMEIYEEHDAQVEEYLAAPRRKREKMFAPEKLTLDTIFLKASSSPKLPSPLGAANPYVFSTLLLLEMGVFVTR